MAKTLNAASSEEEKTIVQSQLGYLNRSDPIITSQLEIIALTRGAALCKKLNLSESKFSSG